MRSPGVETPATPPGSCPCSASPAHEPDTPARYRGPAVPAGRAYGYPKTEPADMNLSNMLVWRDVPGAGRRLAGCGIGRMSPGAVGRYDQPVTKDELLAHCLSKPGAWQDEPWEGDTVVKVGPKIFAFLGSGDPSATHGSVGVKCAAAGREHARSSSLRSPASATTGIPLWLGGSGGNGCTSRSWCGTRDRLVSPPAPREASHHPSDHADG